MSYMLFDAVDTHVFYVSRVRRCDGDNFVSCNIRCTAALSVGMWTSLQKLVLSSAKQHIEFLQSEIRTSNVSDLMIDRSIPWLGL